MILQIAPWVRGDILLARVRSLLYKHLMLVSLPRFKACYDPPSYHIGGVNVVHALQDHYLEDNEPIRV